MPGQIGNKGGGRKGYGYEVLEQQVRLKALGLADKMLGLPSVECKVCAGTGYTLENYRKNGRDKQRKNTCSHCWGLKKVPLEYPEQAFNLLKAIAPKCIRTDVKIEGDVTLKIDV